ncbi:hypothetical protein B0H13DRAFT_2513426 [Mycena leptocephala]|nr:hypothetical protein B0H13DRAFT_2513426 [Mycena leptocephala]
MAQIMDLPTEILIDIFEDDSFPLDTLYSLALLCRRLHFIALPIYFTRHGLALTSNAVVIPMHKKRGDILAALQTALFTPEAQDITFILPHPDCITIFPLLPHLKRLEHYISRLPSATNITLELDVPGSRCLSVGDDRALQTMRFADGEVRWPVYPRLRVGAIHSSQPEHPFAGWCAELLGRRQRSETEDFQRAPHQGPSRIEMTLPPSVHKFSTLSSLTIQSTILILPPGLRWTLAVLRNCPITSLTLGHGVEDPLIWGVVLPRIAPRISSWNSSPGSPTSSGSQYPPTHKAKSTPGRLPNPTPPPRILARAADIRAALPAPPRVLPKLKSLCVLWPQLYVPSNATSLGPALAAIIQEVQAHGLAPRIAVAVSTLMYRAATVGLLPPQYSALDRVTALEICAIPFFYTDIADMAAWIARFRHVGRLEITLSRTAAADADFRVGVGGLCARSKRRNG